MVIPIFKTHGSLGRSLLTVEEKDKETDPNISKDSPISIVGIVNEYKLKELTIIDDTFLSFPQIYSNLNPICNKVVFGINFICCQDVKDKSDKSLKTESKISVLIKNSNGYKDLLKIHNLVHTSEEHFYYRPRICWKTLRDNWSNNLILMLPSYDNFIHKNLLFDSNCVPDLGKIKPILTYSNQELPFDYLLEENIKKYSKSNNYELHEIHNVYYYSNEDAKAYNVYRCVDNRSSFSKPNLEGFSSNKFSWENYCEKMNIKFINE